MIAARLEVLTLKKRTSPAPRMLAAPAMISAKPIFSLKARATNPAPISNARKRL